MINRFFLAVFLLVSFSASSQQAPLPEGWPKSVSRRNGFAELGRAIAKEPAFPKNGTDIEKAGYVVSRLPEIAKVYKLSASTGGASFTVGIARGLDYIKSWWGGEDKENAAALKWTGKGNCGEWSYAFSEMLGGANVPNRVFFADTDPGQGHSAKFIGTDTAVVVTQKTSTGQYQRRVFDPFQAAYNNEKTRQPTDDSVKMWNDLPLTDQDVTEEDKKRFKVSWQQGLIRKPYLKDAVTEKPLSELMGEGPPSSQEKGFLLGKISFQEGQTPAGGIAVEISGERTQSKLTSQNNGTFTAVLPPGDYKVTALLPSGEAGSSAAITIKNGEKTPVELVLVLSQESSDREKTPLYFGSWEGNAKVLDSSQKQLVGTLQPYEIQINQTPQGIELKNRFGLFGNPAQYTTTAEENHLKIAYDGPSAPFSVGAVKVHLSFQLDVTADPDKLKGQLSVTSKGEMTLPQQRNEATEYFLTSLNLDRKGQN